MSVAEVKGELLAADASRGQPASLRAAGGLTLVCEGRSTPLDTGGLAVSHRLSGVARRLTLPDGAVFVTDDDDALEALLAAAGVRVGGRRIAFLEAMRPRMLALVTLLVVGILVSMRWGLPVAADAAARAVPASVEKMMGANSLDILDRLVLSPSRLDAERAAETQVLFSELRRAAGAAADLRLEHRAGGIIHANALALPGGPIVVTDELIDLAPSEDALAGVLAHEIAHVEEHH
ncbi:MAG: M48 family metallopeptidase, partial [Alphaproteobacteria bacterium]|nr:M48 family metallopeptidase [Alphaproteobacteria bacterium]